MENQELIKQVTEKAEKWLTPAYDAETQAEVKRMLENEDKTELIEAFYKDLEFGTGGLRGFDNQKSQFMDWNAVNYCFLYTTNWLWNGILACMVAALYKRKGRIRGVSKEFL